MFIFHLIFIFSIISQKSINRWMHACMHPSFTDIISLRQQQQPAAAAASTEDDANSKGSLCLNEVGGKSNGGENL
jgi:hypothetical protein